jgi:hypothetical protein
MVVFINRFELSKILKNKLFRKYIVYFLSEPITITAVANKISVKNRNKLTNMIHKFRDYKVDIKTYRSKNSRPIQIDSERLISDYISEERDSLFKFVSDVKIKKFLLKNNKDLDQLLNKLILWIFKVDTIAKMRDITDPVYVSDFDSLLFQDYRSPEKLELEIALTVFANHNRKGFAFIDKIWKSNMTTTINIKNLYELINWNLNDHQRTLEYRLRIHDRLRDDSSLIYDPSTGVLQKRSFFMKRKI